MKRSMVLLSLIGLITIEILGVFILFAYDKLRIYNIILITLLIVSVIYLVIYYKDTKNPNSDYSTILKRIYKTFDSVLVQVLEIPNLKYRNIILVANFDDLIDAQTEIRKPISYFEEKDSCTFILLDDKDAYVYILKRDESIRPLIQDSIDEKEKKQENNSPNLLGEIDKTMIIMIDDIKKYKISPIRKKDETKE